MSRYLPEEAKSVLSLAPLQIIAGGTGDNEDQNGVAVDRDGFNSLIMIVPVAATLGQGKTLTFNAKIQESADGNSNWVDVAAASQVVLTGGTGGSTEKTVVEVNASLKGCKRYVRAVCKGDLNATDTDTQRFAAIMLLGSAVVEPA